jgi:hypothetical protein
MRKIILLSAIVLSTYTITAQNLNRFYQNYKVGYSNNEGRVVVAPSYEAGSEFVDGIALVVNNGKRGYIDATGKEIIPLIYDDATLFSEEGLACVKFAGKYGYINKEGQWIIQPIFENAFAFLNGLARIQKDGKYGFINTAGEIVLAPIYTFANDFVEGVSAVQKDGKFGFIDTKGNTKLDFIYQSAQSFKNGKAIVSLGKGEFIYINTSGKKVGEIPKHPEEIERDKIRKEQEKARINNNNNN